MHKVPHIVVGVTGGIAAYKSLFLIRLLRTWGAEVKVVATRNALEFVTELSLRTLSQNKVYTDMFSVSGNVEVEHIALADWADLLVVAPATANIIGKYASGIADDALSTLLLACAKPVFLAPAMNSNMLHHPATQANLQKLQGWGVQILGTGTGFLACGAAGDGRMLEPEQIFESIKSHFVPKRILSGKRALVTAGPTYEPIDPVRFIGNYSSGLMGFQLAETLADAGAQVTLVTGPTFLQTQHPLIQRVDIKTAAQMLNACLQVTPQADIIVMAAAVADYTPQEVAPEKIKKSEANFNLALKKTTDILAEIGKQKTDSQCVVGFALETEHEMDNAVSKLKNKNADIIVLNSLKNQGAGFQCPTNLVTLIDRTGKITKGELKDKREVAQDIVNYIVDYMKIK